MNLSKFIGPKGQAGYLGTNAMQRAIDSGLSMSDIKKYAAKQGLQLGSDAGIKYPKVNAALNKAATKGPQIKDAKNVGQALRIAGGNGISKGEFKDIAKATGKDPEKIIGKLDKINTKLEKRDKAGIDLKSGTGNMLVKKAQKYSDRYGGYRSIDFGEGAIGSTLQSMISTPGNAGTWIKGQLTGGREADPGFNPGGKADKNRLIGGTVLRPSGKIAVKGAGEQYEVPNRFKGAEDPKDPIEKEFSDPDKEIETIEPIEPEEEIDRSASSGAGGLDLASWATGFRKARSARQRSGRRAQGLASQKKNPFKSWA